MKISERQLRRLIIEAYSDKHQRNREPGSGNTAGVTLPGPVIDNSKWETQEQYYERMRLERLKSISATINALIPISLDYKDASDALVSLRRLRKQLSSKSLQEMSSRFPPGREPGFKSTMKPFSLGSLPTDTISSSEADYYSDVDAASVDDYYTGGDDTSGIDIIYDGFEPQFDLTSWDFIINGQEVSTRAVVFTDTEYISHELGDLIAQVTGADYSNPEEEDRIDKIAFDFLTQNQQFQQDLKQALIWQLEYEG